MDDSMKRELKIFATRARMGVLEGVYNAKAGHPGGSLSICDLLSVLYNNELRVDPKNPKAENRDRLWLPKARRHSASRTAICRGTRIWIRCPALI